MKLYSLLLTIGNCLLHLIRGLPTNCVDPKGLKTQYSRLHTRAAVDYMPNVRIRHHSGSNCPNRISRGRMLDISQRSTCPYYYRVNIDVNRYPSRITEAKCSCVSCLNAKGDSTLGCEEVKYFIRVLRRTGCVNGVYVYTPKIETLNVGCTCAGKVPNK